MERVAELVAVSQNCGSSDRTATKQNFDYMNTIRSSNKHILMEYWNSCFAELSKITYVR